MGRGRRRSMYVKEGSESGRNKSVQRKKEGI